MTTANNARKEAMFLYWAIPKNKQPQVPQQITEGQAAVMDSKRLTLAALGPTVEMMLGAADPAGDKLLDVFLDNGEYHKEMKMKMINVSEDLGVFNVRADILRKLLEPMTSESVSLQFNTRGGVWILGGRIGDKVAAVYIAPVVIDQ